jgi:hypothetical protein
MGPEEPFDRLLSAERRVVTQVDAAGLRERCCDRYSAIANEVRRPDVTGAPCDRAVQQHLPVS